MGPHGGAVVFSGGPAVHPGYLVPKLRLGTPVGKLCFPSGEGSGREAELRNRAFPSRAWEREGTRGTTGVPTPPEKSTAPLMGSDRRPGSPAPPCRRCRGGYTTSRNWWTPSRPTVTKGAGGDGILSSGGRRTNRVLCHTVPAAGHCVLLPPVRPETSLFFAPSRLEARVALRRLSKENQHQLRLHRPQLGQRVRPVEPAAGLGARRAPGRRRIRPARDACSPPDQPLGPARLRLRRVPVHVGFRPPDPHCRTHRRCLVRPVH